MRTNAYQNYLEDEILTADPLRLVALLYRGAVDAVGLARRELRNGNIKARSRAITNAVEIIAELQRSLDFESGGDLSLQLARLYDYVQRRLLEANVGQVEPPLAEAENLLRTLLEGWEACQPVELAPSPAIERSQLNSYETDDCEYHSVSYAY